MASPCKRMRLSADDDCDNNDNDDDDDKVVVACVKMDDDSAATCDTVEVTTPSALTPASDDDDVSRCTVTSQLKSSVVDLTTADAAPARRTFAHTAEVISCLLYTSDAADE